MFLKILSYIYFFLILSLENKSLNNIMSQEKLSGEVQIELYIPKKAHQLNARLTFYNNTDRDLWLEKRKVAFNGVILINCFIIKDIKKNTLVEFAGPIVRFKPPLKEDFIIVKPAHTFSSEFRLDNKYSFSKQPSTYSVQFTSTMFPLNEKVSHEYKSNIAIITF